MSAIDSPSVTNAGPPYQAPRPPRHPVSAGRRLLLREVDELGGESVGDGPMEAVVEDAALDDVHLAAAAARELAAGGSLEGDRQEVLAGLRREQQLLEIRDGQP